MSKDYLNTAIKDQIITLAVTAYTEFLNLKETLDSSSTYNKETLDSSSTYNNDDDWALGTGFDFEEEITYDATLLCEKNKQLEKFKNTIQKSGAITPRQKMLISDLFITVWDEFCDHHRWHPSFTQSSTLQKTNHIGAYLTEKLALTFEFTSPYSAQRTYQPAPAAKDDITSIPNAYDTSERYTKK
jgi:hypothetical protein